MWLFAAFLAIPLIEITLFILIGDIIGLGWTLAAVIITAILGTWLVRTQGILAMGQVKSSFSSMRDPTEPIAHGAMILFSGALLLTPGFFTDAVGFALLVPGIRSWMFRAVMARVTVQGFSAGNQPPHRASPHSEIIDAEFEEVDPRSTPPNSPSRWTED